MLGDRIFIMARGRPRCYGTPIYLKNLFGFGYQLRIAKDLKFNEDPETRNKLNSLIKQYFQVLSFAHIHHSDFSFSGQTLLSLS